MKASQLGSESAISILMKGPFGHGKTLAAATFALEGPIHISYWDKKKPIELEHFFYRVIKRPDLLDRIEIDVFSAVNANEFLELYIKFAKDCRYFAVINDSLTNMTSAAVNWHMNFSDNKKGPKKLRVIPDFDEYKAETSLVTQTLDICKKLPCHVIWTCHPVPSVRIEGSGSSMKITKVNPIVTYGSKVAGIAPGNFSEIYHFSKMNLWDQASGRNSTRYIVDTDAQGDDYAKSNIGLSAQMDITNVMFYELWKEQVKKLREEMKHAVEEYEASNVIPFTTIPVEEPDFNPFNQPTKKWNPITGNYE
jgi:hypothetical protein